MSPTIRRRLAWLALLLAPFGLYGWALVVATGSGFNGKIGPAFNGLACDWTIFYTAIEAWRHGHLAQIYDQVWIGHMMQGAYKAWLVNPEPFPAFHYPPTWLLFLAPLAGLSMIGSFAVGQVASLAALVGALAKSYGRQTHRFWTFAAAMLMAPATSNNVLSGQNSVLICAFFVLAFPMLEAQPFLAGAILGLASFKPQMLLMLPFALLGARNWRAIAGAAASSLALAALSALIFGPQVWITWLQLMLHPRHDVAMTGVEWGRLWDDSVYTCAQLLGLTKTGADIVQAAATLAAGALVYLSFRRPLSADRRFAIFLVASVVAAPHVSSYDLVLLALAAVLVVTELLHGEFRPLTLALPLALWLAPLCTPPRVDPVAFALSPAIFAMIFVLMRTATEREAPASAHLALAD